MNWKPTLTLLMLVACSPNSPRPDTAVDEMHAVDNADAAGTMAGMDMAGGGDMPGMSTSGDGPIRITARQASLAGVTFAIASGGPVERTVRAAGMVVPNERGLGIVNARVMGWVEKLYVNETGAMIDSGQPLFELYAPELVTAQEELLLAQRLSQTTGGDTLLPAARRRLALWDIPQDLIDNVLETGTVRRTLTIRSPYRGNVLDKNVIEGQMVNPGDRLFQVADLSTVWMEPAIFEQDIAAVAIGQSATISFDALPGLRFTGRVAFIYPTLDSSTRSLRIRIEVPNATGRIKPMMYGTVRISTAGVPGVQVPLTSVLPSGDTDYAFVLRGREVTPTEVLVGLRGDSTVLVRAGLSPGDTVVSSATFLFDSESSLASAMAGIMLDMGMGLDMGGMDMGGMDMGGAGGQMDMSDDAAGMNDAGSGEMRSPADSGGNR